MIKIQNFHTVEENLERQKVLISPFLKELDLSKPRDKKRFQELNQTAIFLILYSHAWGTVKMDEEPDFEIKRGERLVGLEHTSILNSKLKSKEGSIENLFLRAENQLISECKGLKFLASVYIKNGYSLKKRQSDKDIQEICAVIKRYLQDGVLLESTIIERIWITPHDRISLSPNFGAWWQASLTTETIRAAIEKKENLFQKYKSNTNLEQWLLLVIGNTGDSSYAIMNELKLEVRSQFEKIFLLDFSALSLYEIK